MKIIKSIGIIISIIFLWVGGFIIGLKTEQDFLARHTYPNVGTVTEINREDDSVTFVDGVGFAWSFYGVEDWELGDTVVVIMYDKGTDSILDDEITNIKYSNF